MRILIDKLVKHRVLTTEEYKSILECQDADSVDYLHQSARQISLQNFGNNIYIRGLFEISNLCSNDCYYCGIRKSNTSVKRYLLSHNEILECCYQGYKNGIRTFVLQGGENNNLDFTWLETLVKIIRSHFKDCAITLSLGQMPKEHYQRLFTAGANRYLLRHEAASDHLYKTLHPDTMSQKARLECLYNLKEIGYQTGVGMMVGAPNQTLDDIIQDIKFIYELQPQMIGIGVFYLTMIRLFQRKKREI